MTTHKKIIDLFKHINQKLHSYPKIAKFVKYYLPVILSVVFIIYVSLPFIMESILIQVLLPSYKLDSFRCNVSKFSLFGLDLSEIESTAPDKSKLRIDSVRATYSWHIPWGDTALLELDEVTISGIRVNIREQNKQWLIDGVDLKKFFKAADPNAVPEAKDPAKPWGIAPLKFFHVPHVRITNSTINLIKDKKVLSIPFSIYMRPAANNPREIEMLLQTLIKGEIFKLKAQYFFGINELTLNTEGTLSLQLYEDWLPSMPENFYAQTKFKLDTAISLSTLEINRSEVEASVTLDRKQNKKIALRWSSTKECINNFTLGFENSDNQVSLNSAGSGSLKTVNNELQLSLPLNMALKLSALEQPINVPLQFQANYNIAAGSLTTRNHGGLELLSISPRNNPQINLKIANLKYDGYFNFQNGLYNGEQEFMLPQLTFTAGALQGSLNKLNLTAAIDNRNLSINLQSGFLQMLFDKFKFESPQFNFDATVDTDQEFNGTINLSNGNLEAPQFKTALKNINLNMPLKHSKTNPLQYEGVLNIQDIIFDNHKIAQADFEFEQNKYNLTIDGQINGSQWRDLNIVAHSDIDLSKFSRPTVSAQVKLAQIALPANLGVILSNDEFDEVKLSGDVGLEVNFTNRNDHPEGNFVLNLQKICVNSEAKQLAMKDLNFKLTIPDLIAMRSNAKQKLSISEIKFGNFLFNNIVAIFQIESPRDFLLEKAECDWAGGTLSTYAFRYHAGMDEYETTVYCSDLRLSDIINQINLAHAQGSGTLVGRIPIKINSKGIFFEKSYLYSVPDNINNLKLDKFANEEQINESVESISQLDLTKEALKNFDYEWVKLNFSNTADELIVNMRIKGKPNGPLPFTYEEKTGNLIRTPGAKTVFQGFDLNINNKLPLNHLFDLNNKIMQKFNN